MWELFRIHRERNPMYRQSMMEELQQQPQILTKLAELPIVNDTYSQVLDVYQRTKGHNLLFRTYFGLAESTAKVVIGISVPIIQYGFQSQIDQLNHFACNKLDSLEEKFPIITHPTQEVIQETKEQYEKVWPYVEPFTRPVAKPARLALKMGKTAISVGKAAVDVGTTVASTAMKPAVYAVNVGTSVTAAVADKSKQAVNSVASGAMAKGQEVVDASMSTPLGKFWLQQVDITLDAIEKLLNNYYLPSAQDDDQGEVEVPETRTERVLSLASRIQSALYQKAEGDMIRYRMLASNLLQELMELTGFYFTLMKDGATMLWENRQETFDAVDQLWNKYISFIPEAIRPTDPCNRLVVLLRLVTERLGELFTKFLPAVLQGVSDGGQAFVNWCKRISEQAMTQGIEATIEMAVNFVKEFINFLPYIPELLHFLLDKVVDLLDVFGIAGLERRGHVSTIPEEENIEMQSLS